MPTVFLSLIKEQHTKFSNAFIVLFLLVFSYSNAQKKAVGIIRNSSNLFVSNVSIIGKDSTNIISYTFSDENGKYSIDLKDKITMLTYSSLGYKSKDVLIDVKEIRDTLKVNIILEEAPFDLEEVIISEKIPLRQKKDTIVFDAKFYSKGTEEVVEDLLKNIPGLNIDQSGTIKSR